MTSSNPKSVNQLFVITIILLIIGFITIFNFDLEISRLVTLLSTGVLFVVFLFHKGFQSRILFGSLTLLVLRDLVTIWYETEILKTIAFLATFFAYSRLIYYALQNVKLRLFQKEVLVFALLIIGLNVFNLYYMSETVTAKLDNSIQETFFYLQGALILFLGLVAFLYNDAFFGKRVLMYLYVVIALIFSDLSGLAAYFFDIEVAFYPHKICYITGFSLLVYIHIISKNSGYAALRAREDVFI